MRFSVLAMLASLLWLTTGRAQEPSGARKNAATSKNAPALPDMPAPKPPVAFPRWRCWSCLHPKRGRGNVTVQPSTWGLPSRVADRKFFVVAGGAIASSRLVAAGTNHCRHTVGVGRCVGSDGPFRATQGVQIALSGVMTGIGYGWKKSDQETHEKHRRWWVFPSVATAVNMVVALDQFSKRCPRGTLFDGRTCK